jgi:excisionase family DNA binding protein
MKAELNIDTNELINEISEKVINALLPFIRSNEGENIIFDVNALAEYIKVSTGWIYDHMSELPYYKVGKHNRFRKSEIDEWLKGKKEEKNSKAVKKTSNHVRRLLEDMPSKHDKC